MPSVASVTVASWNVREALPVDSSSRASARAEIAATVREHGIDVLALQEVDFQDDGSETISYLLAHTGLRYHCARRLSPSSYFDGHSAGVAVLSRFPLTAETDGGFLNPELSITLHGNEIGSHDKGFVSAVVRSSGSAFRIVSLHAVPYHLFRRDPADPEFGPVWRDLAKILSAFIAEPLVVCGDFNASDRRLLLEAGDLPLTQVFPGVTTYGDEAADDVLVSKHFRGQDAAVLPNFSDHLLCLANVVC